MRSDMAKVITERPRSGGGVKAPKGERKALQKDFENAPRTESMRKKWKSHYGNWTKEFTDVLGPLEGFLKANVGRPWDKIYSEVRKVLRPTGMSAIHAIGHLYQMVALARDIYIGEDKKVYPKASSLWRRYDKGKEMPIHEDYYVDPNDGILKKTKHDRYRRQKKEPLFIKTDKENVVYKKLDGLWYAVTLSPLVRCNVPTLHYLNPYDCCFKMVMVIDANRGQRRLIEEYGKLSYAKSKQQLGKREIKRLGLA
jgi:hypothetical protein